jgi:hypothetical protein
LCAQSLALSLQSSRVERQLVTIDTQGDLTRPEIDRVGSAWIIRKSIDPEAKFVLETSRPPIPWPSRMLDVEFSHHGDHCTFETLIERFGIRDRAVQRLAELIHDADLEDDKFHRIDSAVTAAVVGVVLNLAVWFGLHVIFPIL